MRQYSEPAGIGIDLVVGIGLIIIGLALFTSPVYAEVRNLEVVFGLDPLTFLPIGVVLVSIGVLLIDRDWQ